jgi:DNA-directed RNA polymerase subunit H (RpoH/RPB5)
MSTIIEKVYNARETIIDIYKDFEWDTKTIPKLSISELETMFTNYNSTNPIIQSMGGGMAFTLRIKHKIIENHNLVVIFYNLSNADKKSSKINKSIIDKIIQLYSQDYLNNDDSLLILINENNSESIEKINHTLNYKLKENYIIPSDIKKYIYSPDNKKSDNKNYNKYKESYFRNCIIMGIDMFQVNILNHYLVPKHEIIYDKEEIEQIFKKHNMNKNQMPVISRVDNIAKIIRINTGNICKITRNSEKSGENIYYRYCR